MFEVPPIRPAELSTDLSVPLKFGMLVFRTKYELELFKFMVEEAFPNLKAALTLLKNMSCKRLKTNNLLACKLKSLK